MTPSEQYAAFLRHAQLIHPGFNKGSSSLRHVCGFLEDKIKVNDIRPLRGEKVMEDLRRNSPKDHEKYLPALAELFRVWGSTLPYQISPIGPVHRRQSFNAGLHVGAENELKGTTIVLLDSDKRPVTIGYGMRIARTKGETNVHNNNKDPRRQGFLPLADFQVEGASGGTAAHTGPTGMIEVVGGPMNVNDNATSVECLGIFIEQCIQLKKRAADLGVTIGEETYSLFKLQRVVDEYNRVLRKKGSAFQPYVLELTRQPGATWYLSVADSIKPSTQLNFEVPFVKIGQTGQGMQDFVSAFRETPTKCPTFGRDVLFKNGRQLASAFVADNFRKTTDATELQYLRSYVTLLIFVACIKVDLQVWASRNCKEKEDHEQKNRFEVLPKIELHDMLHRHIVTTCPELKTMLGGDGKHFLALRGALVEACIEAYRTSFNFEVRENSKDKLRQLFGDQLARVWAAYNPSYKYTATGKPLPASTYIARENDGRSPRQVLTVVFEMRTVTVGFSKLGNLDRLVPASAVKPLRLMNDLQAMQPSTQ